MFFFCEIDKIENLLLLVKFWEFYNSNHTCITQAALSLEIWVGTGRDCLCLCHTPHASSQISQVSTSTYPKFSHERHDNMVTGQSWHPVRSSVLYNKKEGFRYDVVLSFLFLAAHLLFSIIFGSLWGVVIWFSLTVELQSCFSVANNRLLNLSV